MVVFKLSNVQKPTLPLNSQKKKKEELPALLCDRAWALNPILMVRENIYCGCICYDGVFNLQARFS